MPAAQLLSRLPAIFGEDPALGDFLVPFEKILLGPTSDGSALREIIAGLAAYFDPTQAPSEFLGWLAGWVALNLRADLDEAQRRSFIANAVPLYRLRGTKAGLERFLYIYTGLAPTITEYEKASFQIGVHSTVGVDTFLAGGGEHYFKVVIRISQPDPAAEEKFCASPPPSLKAKSPRIRFMT